MESILKKRAVNLIYKRKELGFKLTDGSDGNTLSLQRGHDSNGSFFTQSFIRYSQTGCNDGFGAKGGSLKE